MIHCSRSDRLQKLAQSTVKNYVFDSRFYGITHQKRLNVIAGTKLIKKLQINNYKHVMALTADSKGRIVDSAFDIYHNIHGQKDSVLLNTMLKLMLYFEHPHKVLVIWNDIMDIINDRCSNLSWALLMLCCIKSRIDIDKCIDVLKCLKSQNCTVNLDTLYIGKLIHKCNIPSSLSSLKYIHSLLSDGNIQCKDNKTHFVKTPLIVSYGKCLSLSSALDVFNSFTKDEVDAVGIAAMLKAYITNEEYTEALVLYDNIDCDVLFDDITHTLAIKACKYIPNYEKGKNIAHKIKLDKEKTHCALKNTLIDFYGHLAEIEKAETIYNEYFNGNDRDIITINAMMKAYVNSNCCPSALKLYGETDDDILNQISHVIALNAAADLNHLSFGKDIHNKIINIKNKSIVLNTALIDLYGKCGDIVSAEKVFDTIKDEEKNIICMNAMLAAYCSNKANSECIELFKNMRVAASVITYQILFRACTNGTSFYFGRKIHETLKRNIGDNWGILNDVTVEVNLINMYSKCGMLDVAQNIFNKSKKRDCDISYWNAMIHGFGKMGNMCLAKDVYNKMKTETNLIPNDKTFMSLLIACSYSGNQEDADIIWQNDIKKNLEMKYNKYIIAALVDCLSRRGSLNKAFDIIIEYETKQDNAYDDVMWGSLLNGCIKHRDEYMAEKVFEEMIFRFKNKEKYSKRMAAASVMIRNIYFKNCKHDKVQKIRDLMQINDWNKEPGFSEIDVYGKLHKFFAGNDYIKQKEYESIDSKLEELCHKFKREHGYTHDYTLITRPLNPDETEESVLWRHSEKIALCFGLLNTARDYVIVINKNLRICSDCHDFVRLSSLTENRKIVVSDANRVHVFQNGICSCNEYY